MGWRDRLFDWLSPWKTHSLHWEKHRSREAYRIDHELTPNTHVMIAEFCDRHGLLPNEFMTEATATLIFLAEQQFDENADILVRTPDGVMRFGVLSENRKRPPLRAIDGGKSDGDDAA